MTGPADTPADGSATGPADGSAGGLVVLGAGPAGLAAALTAARLGVPVTLVDSAAAPGGQILRQQRVPGGPSAEIPVDGLPERFRNVAAHPRIRLVPSSEVWHAGRTGGTPHRDPDGNPDGDSCGFRIALTGAEPAVLHARAVVLATGATELALPFPGWDLPGVTTAGAAQALLKGGRTAVGERVLVAGSGPFLLPVAAGLVTAGVHVVAVLEATRLAATPTLPARMVRHPAKLREAAGYLAVLARHRVPVRTGVAVLACQGRGQVSRATEFRVDGDWRPRPGTGRPHRVDAVCVSFGFVPRLELARQLGCRDVPHPTRPSAAVWHDADQATSVPGVFAAGEITGVGGALVAELEGRLAGVAAARHLGRIDADRAAALAGPMRERLRRARAFAALLERGYPFRSGWTTWPDARTVTCRCEETPWATVRRAVAGGARDARAVRSFTRCGMGYCQGRVCGPVVQGAIAAQHGLAADQVGGLHDRPLAVPVTLAELAALAEPSEPDPGRTGPTGRHGPDGRSGADGATPDGATPDG